MKTLSLSSKNQIVVPKAVRVQMKLSSGDGLIVEKITNDRVTFKKAPTYHDLIGSIAPSKEDAVDRIRKLREDWR